MYIGLDIGTSGLKGLLISDDQKILAEAKSGLSVSRPHAGWSEQNPHDWVVACESIFDSLSAQHTLSDVSGIGLSGHMHGAVLVDKNHQILRPCMLWNDTRSHAEATAMDADPIWRQITGNIVFPGFTAPKLAWIERNEPDIFHQIHKVLLPKDYLRFWLTGEYFADMSDASGSSWLDTEARDWSDKLLTASNLTRDHMPALIEGSSISSCLRKHISDRWSLPQKTIVAGGGGDNAASAIGVGVVNSGDAFISLGTSGVLFAANDGYHPDPATAVHTFCHALPKTWHQMGVILSATDSLEWYARLVGESAADLTGDLGKLKVPASAIFLPYLSGERTPHNDARVRGAFLGLEQTTDTRCGTRAILEGVAFAIRDCRNALAKTGTKIESLIAIGGGSASGYWLEALATTLDTPIDIPVAGDFGAAFGAARLALMASTGCNSNVALKPNIAKRIEPDTKLSSAFDDGYERYKEGYQAIKNLSPPDNASN